MAVLVMAGSFVSGAAAGSTSTAAAIVANFPVHAELGPPSDPFFVDQWGLQSIGAPNAWSVTPGDRSILVAVVDTGVWWTQPDIQANMWTNSADGTHGHDFVDGDSNPMDVDPSGQVYHGTGVAGVIAAITDNGQGIAGTAQISVIAVRALGPNGQGSSFNTSQSIRWAADRGARVINLSLGTNETFIGPTDIQLAVDYAWSKARSSSPPPETPGSGRSTIRHDCRTWCPLRPSMNRGVGPPSRTTGAGWTSPRRGLGSSRSTEATTSPTTSTTSKGPRSPRPS